MSLLFRSFLIFSQPLKNMEYFGTLIKKKVAFIHKISLYISAGVSLYLVNCNIGREHLWVFICHTLIQDGGKQIQDVLFLKITHASAKEEECKGTHTLKDLLIS